MLVIILVKKGGWDAVSSGILNQSMQPMNVFCVNGYGRKMLGILFYFLLNSLLSKSDLHWEILQKLLSYGGGESLRPVAGGMGGHPVDETCMMGVGGMDGQSDGYGKDSREITLPPDASSTLYVEGLPLNCTRREVSRILR